MYVDVDADTSSNLNMSYAHSEAICKLLHDILKIDLLAHSYFYAKKSVCAYTVCNFYY